MKNQARAALAGALLCAGLGPVAGPASAQVIYRCIVDGQPVYQQDACRGGSQRSERLQTDPRFGELVPVQPEPPRPPRPARSVASAEAASDEQPSLAPASAPTRPPAAEAKPRLTVARPAAKPLSAAAIETQAEACMDWYRPMLREPQAAYRTTPRKEGQELIMMIHAPDGQGGFQSRAASCEFGDEGLDAAATQVHAQRRGWKALANKP